jgi:hypothetical protein
MVKQITSVISELEIKKMTLRSHLADFPRVNISPLWNNAEFNEFIDLIEDPNAR